MSEKCSKLILKIVMELTNYQNWNQHFRNLTLYRITFKF